MKMSEYEFEKSNGKFALKLGKIALDYTQKTGYIDDDIIDLLINAIGAKSKTITCGLDDWLWNNHDRFLTTDTIKTLTQKWDEYNTD
jgi:hypothetical protein